MGSASEDRKFPMKYGMTVARVPAATISRPDFSLFFFVKIVFHTPIASESHNHRTSRNNEANSRGRSVRNIFWL